MAITWWQRCPAERTSAQDARQDCRYEPVAMITAEFE
jgi:hypothetical protein